MEIERQSGKTISFPQALYFHFLMITFIQNSDSLRLVAHLQASLDDVRRRVAELHIQVGNLVQFLPQDRVTSFAAMSESQLLKSTEEAIGGEELLKMHQELITANNSILSGDTGLNVKCSASSVISVAFVSSYYARHFIHRFAYFF